MIDTEPRADTDQKPVRKPSRRAVLAATAGVTAAAAGGAVWETRAPRPHDRPVRGALLFEDDFTDPATIDRHNTNGSPSWFTALPFGWGPNRADLTVAHSVLRIEQRDFNANWALATRSPDDTTGRTFGRGYYEARMRFDPALGLRSPGWPAFWSMPAQRIARATKRWPEIDFFEAYTGGRAAYDRRFYGVVHDWRAGEPQYAVSTRNPFTVDVTPEWHTFGCEWRAGRVEWFLDEASVGVQEYSATRVAPAVEGGAWHQRVSGVALTSLDEADGDMTVVLGSGPSWPLEVDWVRIWA